jgi:hypothetical protein
MTESLNLILNANLVWLQQIVDLLEQPPLLWFVAIALLFSVLGFIKALISMK